MKFVLFSAELGGWFTGMSFADGTHVFSPYRMDAKTTRVRATAVEWSQRTQMPADARVKETP